MIADLFLYFAQFPNKRGVRAMATLGKSQFEEYAQMLDAIDAIEGDGRVPKIDHYVYGQTFDELKQLVDTLTSSNLPTTADALTSAPSGWPLPWP